MSTCLLPFFLVYIFCTSALESFSLANTVIFPGLPEVQNSDETKGNNKCHKGWAYHKIQGSFGVLVPRYCTPGWSGHLFPGVVVSQVVYLKSQKRRWDEIHNEVSIANKNVAYWTKKNFSPRARRLYLQILWQFFHLADATQKDRYFPQTSKLLKRLVYFSEYTVQWLNCILQIVSHVMIDCFVNCNTLKCSIKIQVL